MSSHGLVFDIQRYAIHDGPGIRTTVFLKGCPLRCPWCHNPEGQSHAAELLLAPALCLRCGACADACPRGVARPAAEAPSDGARCARCGACVAACPSGARRLAGLPMEVEDVLAAAERDRVFYEESGGGVTFSGGEPLAQPDFLRACLAGCRARGLHAAVDTCGHAPTAELLEAAGAADLVLLDLKAMDDARHRRLTGVSNRLILDNARALSERGTALWLRLPLLPGRNDDRENLVATARFARSLASVRQVNVLPYHRAGSGKYPRLGRADAMAGEPEPTPAQVAAAVSLLADEGLTVKVGG